MNACVVMWLRLYVARRQKWLCGHFRSTRALAGPFVTHEGRSHTHSGPGWSANERRSGFPTRSRQSSPCSSPLTPLLLFLSFAGRRGGNDSDGNVCFQFKSAPWLFSLLGPKLPTVWKPSAFLRKTPIKIRNKSCAPVVQHGGLFVSVLPHVTLSFFHWSRFSRLPQKSEVVLACAILELTL